MKQQEVKTVSGLRPSSEPRARPSRGEQRSLPRPAHLCADPASSSPGTSPRHFLPVPFPETGTTGFPLALSPPRAGGGRASEGKVREGQGSPLSTPSIARGCPSVRRGPAAGERDPHAEAPTPPGTWDSF